MRRTLLIIVAVTPVAVAGTLFSSCKKEAMTPEEAFARKGGLHVVVEVDDLSLAANEREEAIGRTVEIIRNRVDQLGVGMPHIKRDGEKRIIVQLPGLQDVERAVSLVGTTGLLEFRLVREPEEVSGVLAELDRVLEGVRVVGAEVDSTRQTGARSALAPESVAELQESADTSGLDAGGQEVSPLDSLLATLPETQELKSFTKEYSEDRPFTSYLLAAFGDGLVVDERDRKTVDLLLGTAQAQRVIPKQSEFLWESESRPIEGGAGRLLYLVERQAALTGSTITDARAQEDPDYPHFFDVAFQLNGEGALVFSRLTSENIGRRIAIVLDHEIRSAPVVQARIPSGEARIAGGFSEQEANDLAILLRTGALPAPVKIIEERIVPPSRKN